MKIKWEDDIVGITVKEILNLSELKDCKVIAGENGIGRVVNYVITMDSPDAAKWIRGNELLLTAGYIFKNNSEIEKNFIKEINSKNCSALGIKLGRFIESISSYTIESANYYNFPIIEIPTNTSWHDIVNPIFAEIADREVRQLKRSKQIHDELTKVVLRGGGLHSIAKVLSRILKCNVFIEDESFNLMTYYIYDENNIDALSKEIINTSKLPCDIFEEISERKILDDVKKYKETKRFRLRRRDCGSRIVTPIIVKNEICGYITIAENNKLSDYDLIAVEQAATTAALEFLKDIEIKQAEGKAKKDFLENIIIGKIKDTDFIKSRFEMYNINIGEFYIIIVFITNYDTAISLEEDNFRLIMKALNKEDNKCLIFRRGEEIVTIYDVSEKNNLDDKYRLTYESCLNVCSIINEKYGDDKVKCGISTIKSSYTELSRGYYESLRSIELADFLKRKDENIFLYNKFWIYDLLLKRGSVEELKEFCDKRLLKLEEYDKKNPGEDLFNTLRVYVENCGKHSVTAEKLFIHRNTLSYKINKINNLIDFNINIPEERFKIEMSFKIMDIVKHI